jgi:DNA polymerase
VEREAFLDQLRRRADYLKELGLDYALDRPELRARLRADSASSPRAVREAPEPRLFSEAMVSQPQDSGPAERLKGIQQEMGDCRRCRLCEGRTQIVFGAGNPSARVLFVGEGPGAEEDRQGIPFVGKAGQLLTDIITKGMGVRRESVYIANVVKCRPPENRTPQGDEMAACLPFLEAQIEAVNPEVIVALGATACQGLLGAPVQITKIRGRWTNFRGIPLMPTFHPSYLLRNPAAKKEVWQDIQEVMAKLGLPRKR